jgi:hypothetical protein
MTRVLLALVFAVGLTAAANAAVVQFSVDGVPVDGTVPIEVLPSDEIMVDVWIVPDAPIENFWVDILPTGPWDPFVQSGFVVQMLPPWDNDDSFAGWDPGYGVYSIGGFIRVEPWAGPGAVAQFLVHIPDVPISTILNLEYDYAEVGAGGAQALPLILHVTPEPATIGLLVLGGLAALGRKFA